MDVPQGFFPMTAWLDSCRRPLPSRTLAQTSLVTRQRQGAHAHIVVHLHPHFTSSTAPASSRQQKQCADDIPRTGRSWSTTESELLFERFLEDSFRYYFDPARRAVLKCVASLFS
jgi:hypothetical protein